ERLWRAAQADIELLYQRFNSYGTVLTKAREGRARRNRPGTSELTELATLLRGAAVVLATEEIALGRRNLPGPTMIPHTMSLAVLVAPMDRSAQSVSDLESAVD